MCYETESCVSNIIYASNDLVWLEFLQVFESSKCFVRFLFDIEDI